MPSAGNDSFVIENCRTYALSIVQKKTNNSYYFN